MTWFYCCHIISPIKSLTIQYVHFSWQMLVGFIMKAKVKLADVFWKTWVCVCVQYMYIYGTGFWVITEGVILFSGDRGCTSQPQRFGMTDIIPGCCFRSPKHRHSESPKWKRKKKRTNRSEWEILNGWSQISIKVNIIKTWPCEISIMAQLVTDAKVSSKSHVIRTVESSKVKKSLDVWDLFTRRQFDVGHSSDKIRFI